jgi:hypothetical protein
MLLAAASLALAVLPGALPGQAGYGGARVAVTGVGPRTALLGGGPLVAVTRDRLTAGVMIAPTEGDAEGLQLVPVGPFVEYDLTPTGRFHVLPAVQIWTGAAIYDDGPSRSSAAVIGLEPRITVTTGGSSTRIGLSLGWRFARATAGLGGLDRDLSGFAAGFELRDGVLGPGAGDGGSPGLFLTSLYANRVTRFAGQTVHLAGGGTRLAFGRWVVGVGGYVTRDWFRDRALAVGGGWGGLVAEYHAAPAGPGPWVGVLVGGGGLGRRIAGTDEYETAGMFVVEPSAGLELAVLPFLHLGVTAGYRLAGCGECIPGVENADVGGVSAGLDLRFGHYGSARER